MKKLFTLFVLVSFASILAQTPEWSFDKAERLSSLTREQVCINGLWQFRSEPSLKPNEKTKIFYQDDIKENTIKNWIITNVPGIEFIPSADTSKKTTGDASLKLDFSVTPATNLYHCLYYIDNLPTGQKLTLEIDAMADFSGPPLYIEIQDAEGFHIYCVTGTSIQNKKGWHKVACDFTLPGQTKRIKILLPRSQAGGCKGTLWFDNLKVLQRSILPTEGCNPPQDNNWGTAPVPGTWFDRVMTNWNSNDPSKDNPTELKYGWYRRTIELPQYWSGRTITLHANRLATNAVVFCNGNRAGSLSYLEDQIDLTKHTQAGKSNTLEILVESMDRWEVLPGFLSRPRATWQLLPSAAGIAGDVFLISQAPAQATVQKPQIITKVQGEKTLRIIADITGNAQGLNWKANVKHNGNIVKTFEGKLEANKLDATVKWDDPPLWDIDDPNLLTLTIELIKDNAVIDQTLPETFGFREFQIRGKYFYLNDIKLNLNPCAIWTRSGNWDTKAAMKHWLNNAKRAGYNYVYMEDDFRPGSFDASHSFLDICDQIGMLAAITPISIGSGTAKLLEVPEKRKLWEDNTEIVVKTFRNHPSLAMWRMNMNLYCYPQDQNPNFLDGKLDFLPDSKGEILEKAALQTNEFVTKFDPTRPNYNHASGKIGQVYTLNNYLGFPEHQDIREWLRQWATNADKPLCMVEQATPYPGDFQMRDPTSWWQNEPLMTEYGAITLGEQAYELEEHDYVDYIQSCWAGTHWNSSYGYFTFNYPPILDECVVKTYTATFPAWRTWGISGGVNTWENAWRRLIKNYPNSPHRYAPQSPVIPVDWSTSQKPGRLSTTWRYDSGGGGEIRSFYDRGTPDEMDYFQPTKRSYTFKRLLAKNFAYIAGPNDLWFTQDHHFYADEAIAKSIILINDLRKPQTFKVNWKASIAGAVIASGNDEATVQPAETHHIQFQFKAPDVVSQTDLEITATVITADNENIPVAPFKIRVYPKVAPQSPPRQMNNCVLLDNTGKTQDAFRKLGFNVQTLNPDQQLPDNITTVFVAELLLDDAIGKKAFTDIAKKVNDGLNIVILAQSDKALASTFGFRAFTPGVRFVYPRASTKKIVMAGLDNTDLENWRGQTTLGEIPPPPESLEVSQREKRVWRCSTYGVVASTIIEKPHKIPINNLADTGFDLRYSTCFEIRQNKGSILFCQFDLVDRIGSEPVADTILERLIIQAQTSTLPRPPLVATHAGSAALFKDLPAANEPPSSPDQILVLSRGCLPWLAKHKDQLETKMKQPTNCKIFAVGLTLEEAELLAQCSSIPFTVATATNWLNPFPDDLLARLVFTGLSSADFRWRRKTQTTVITSASARLQRLPSGVAAVSHSFAWFSALPEDFDPKTRPDLVFTQVKTERTIRTMLLNLGATFPNQTNLATALQNPEKPILETQIYSDTRKLRDDPYADMRW